MLAVDFLICLSAYQLTNHITTDFFYKIFMLTESHMFEVSIKTHFAAAHWLRNYKGKCENLHGHNWVVEVTVCCEELNDIGLVMDFSELKQITQSVLSQFDHKCLNDIPPFDTINTSSENMARFLYHEIGSKLKNHAAHIRKVSVWESDRAWASYYEPDKQQGTV